MGFTVKGIGLGASVMVQKSFEPTIRKDAGLMVTVDSLRYLSLEHADRSGDHPMAAFMLVRCPPPDWMMT